MNPTLAVKDATTGGLRGPAFDLATALAARMGVKLDPIALPSPGAAAQGIADRAFDVTFLVSDPARAAVMEFSAPCMESDLTCLVAAGSKIARVDDINAAAETLRAAKADAVAAPRPVLAVQRAKLAGSKLLDEGFARISYAVVVSKGRSELLAYSNDFVDEAKASGLVKNTIEAAGLQGVRVPPKP
jgi:polar amino acid transport system substrate-binding protein